MRVVLAGDVVWLHVEDRQSGGARGVNRGADITLADANGLGLRLREAHVYEIAVWNRRTVDITDAPEVQGYESRLLGIEVVGAFDPTGLGQARRLPVGAAQVERHRSQRCHTAVPCTGRGCLAL